MSQNWLKYWGFGCFPRIFPHGENRRKGAKKLGLFLKRCMLCYQTRFRPVSEALGDRENLRHVSRDLPHEADPENTARHRRTSALLNVSKFPEHAYMYNVIEMA